MFTGLSTFDVRHQHLGVAIMDGIFPIRMGICISYLEMEQDLQTSVAVVAHFVVNVSNRAKSLNTPIR